MLFMIRTDKNGVTNLMMVNLVKKLFKFSKISIKIIADAHTTY